MVEASFKSLVLGFGKASFTLIFFQVAIRLFVVLYINKAFFFFRRIKSLFQLMVDRNEFESSRKAVCNYSSCRILQFLELSTHIATETVPIYRLQKSKDDVINFNGSFFLNKESLPIKGSYSWGYLRSYFFNVFAPSKLRIYMVTPKDLVCPTFLMI